MTNLPKLTASAIDHFAPMPTQPPAEWCCENLRFDEPGNRGPFTTAGREYIIEPLNDWANMDVADCVEVFGSQTGKTGMLMAGAAWSVVNDPCGILWVMPSIQLAQSFSEVRFQPMVRASEQLARLIPEGSARHAFKKLQQQLGASVINFVGSNSPSNLASRPARKVVLDEVDKFDDGGTGEADAVNLAEQRTKGQSYPQRRKTSTPSMVEGLIWQEFSKGDQRRYFVPCPLCGKFIVLAWSAQYTVLPKLPELSYVVWDKEAKRPDGSWDLDRVVRSARVRCVHCGGDIADGHKTRMLAGGEWRPTAKAELGFRSRHLPSLYACSPETTFGKMAVRFLQAKQSLMGLQGFINGDLAEPYESQDRQAERVELITEKMDITDGAASLMTVDCQASSPHFWYVVRQWAGGNSHGVAAGSCDTWEDLREIQLKHSVKDVGVVVDSGYGARDDAEVYRSCARFCERIPTETGRPELIGWMPAKGMPTRRRWKDDATGLMIPYYMRKIDPYVGTADAGSVAMSLFEFSGDFFKDVLESLRGGKGGFTWAVSESVATEDYWRHMDAEIKTAVHNKKTGRTTWQWAKRSARWPNHLLDCEVMQVAAATFYGVFTINEEQE